MSEDTAQPPAPYERIVLLPCPFCGFDQIEVHSFDEGEHSCYCFTCGSRSTAFNNPTLAMESWNSRAKPPEQVAALNLIEQFSELVDGDLENVGGGTCLGFDGRLTVQMIKAAKRLCSPVEQ